MNMNNKVRQDSRGNRWLRATSTLGIIVACLRSVATAQEEGVDLNVTTRSACVDFEDGASPEGSSWTLQDCMYVWSEWYDTVPPRLQKQKFEDREKLRKSAVVLRQKGSPCFVRSEATPDGAGSSTIRHITTWMFAEEMGCNWVSPDYGGFRQVDESGLTSYCHRVETKNDAEKLTLEQLKANRAMNCVLVNWQQYFSFDDASFPMPESGAVYTINGDTLYAWAGVKIASMEIQAIGADNLPWDHLLMSFSKSGSSMYMMSVNSWDEHKRAATRSVLQQMRTSFHQVPRQGYSNNPECAYSPSSLNFAIHVRMGDRRQFQGANMEYFELLEMFMDKVTAGVVGSGQPPPLFHVFSEVQVPCPDSETALFQEFPTWPVELDQIEGCVNADTPEDCPEKRAGVGVCKPNRSGVFRIQGQPLVLHVGTDVVNTMSCMIKADGLLLGCSTFGQVAGLLSNGIRFFSERCGGDMTPVHYKMIPPMAVAERGDRWVPVSGSWRDPVLRADRIFQQELEKLLAKRSLT